MNRPSAIRTVVIVGGGTAGWMAAAALTSVLPRGSVNVRLVESELIGIVGVGEATIPHIRNFNETIGVDEASFMAATNATFKLGIEFVNWGRIGDAYIHPFGAYGAPLNAIAFHQYWRKFANDPDAVDISEYSLPIKAAYKARFQRPSEDAHSVHSTYGYAYQFDATKYAPFLRRHAEERGAIRTEGLVVDATRDSDTGDIISIRLASGEEIEGDFFFDCSGFRGLLIEDFLKSGYEQWDQWLPCDRAVAVPCESKGPLLPFTRATARQAGWQWRIPLQHRVGNGHVYSSKFLNDDDAKKTLIDNLEGDALAEPRLLKFVTGRRRKFWASNCVAVGLSGGFLEPLESTSIHLIQTAITNFIELFPASNRSPIERDEYNGLMSREFERVRDFLILHYHATERTDSDFWNYVRTMSIPSSLEEKMSLFKERGRVATYQQGLFLEPSWIAVYLGQRVMPSGYDQRVDLVDEAMVTSRLDKKRSEIMDAVDAMDGHADFLKQVCAESMTA